MASTKLLCPASSSLHSFLSILFITLISEPEAWKTSHLTAVSFPFFVELICRFWYSARHASVGPTASILVTGLQKESN